MGVSTHAPRGGSTAAGQRSTGDVVLRARDHANRRGAWHAGRVSTVRPPADLGDYAPLASEADGPLRLAARDVALREFDRLMAARAERVAALTALATRHGVDLAADDAPLALGRWLVAAGAEAGPEALEDPRWAGLAVDVALWLGERVLARAHAAGGALRWELYTGVKKSTGYQRAVLTGFRRVDDPRYYVDIAHFVGGWLELALRRRPARVDFLAVIEATTLRDA